MDKLSQLEEDMLRQIISADKKKSPMPSPSADTPEMDACEELSKRKLIKCLPGNPIYAILGVTDAGRRYFPEKEREESEVSDRKAMLEQTAKTAMYTGIAAWSAAGAAGITAVGQLQGLVPDGVRCILIASIILAIAAYVWSTLRSK